MYRIRIRGRVYRVRFSKYREQVNGQDVGGIVDDDTATITIACVRTLLVDAIRETRRVDPPHTLANRKRRTA
jgi:hypothetical protein